MIAWALVCVALTMLACTHILAFYLGSEWEAKYGKQSLRR